MRTYIALLRGINVGGSRKLLMKDLKTLLADLGARQVRTYIQSGNVVFQSDEADRAALGERISAEIEEQFGFAPRVMLLTAEELAEAMSANPFPAAEAEPKTLHLSFLSAFPEDPDLETLESLRAPSEAFELKARVFYLHAPEGIGRSKLAEKVERLLGVPATARNWRTVSKVMALANE